jgi:hypothetical protein
LTNQIVDTTCSKDTFAISYSVDRFETIPKFITETILANGDIKLNIVPIDTDIGIYTIRVKFYSLANPQISTDTSLLLEIYPNIAYGTGITENNCPSTIYPMQLFNSDTSIFDVKFKSADVNQANTVIIYCGSSK